MIEAAWAEALTLELRYEVRPGENIEPPVRTEMFLTYDDARLLIGFKCHDPDPSRIRARFSDRDQAWADDWVGVVLDTFNDERRAYELFVNPYGVQMDAINDDVAWSYDMAWNAIWASAGRITADGYEVEMAIPFNQLRFQAVAGPQVWGIDGVRSYPREQRHHIGMFPRQRGNNSYLSQAEKIEGFEGIAPGRNLEILPTVTATRTDGRPDGSTGPFERRQAAGDVGATVRWGITPNVTANLAVNPDFSQVEADAVQLDVNNEFALFFPETRPFFLEGVDYFNLRRMNLVHTRTIADPIGALKATGKHGRHTYGVFSARDARTDLLVPGPQRSRTRTFEQPTTALAARYRLNVGRNSAVGLTLTDREGGGYVNRVLAVDTTYRISPADTVIVTAARSATRYAGAMQAELDLPAGRFADGALEARYRRSTRNWFANGGYADYGDGFRAGLGFVTQVDYRKWDAALGRLWHGGGGGVFNQIGVSGSAEYSADREGRLLDRAARASVSYIGPRETFAFAVLERRDRVFSGRRFAQRIVRGQAMTRPIGAVQLGLRFRAGDGLDVTHARPGADVDLQPQATLHLGRRWRLQYTHTFNRLDLDAGRLFTARVAEPRVVYQIGPRAFVRVILQYTRVRRDPALYVDAVEADSRDLFAQVLFSYKVNPQTVLYLGYADNHVGADRFRLLQTDRTFFVKAGYAWLP